jgi:hypothetical protein
VSAAKLSVSSICGYTQLVKLVMASAVNEHTGDQLFPIVWNNEFAGVPIIGKQHQCLSSPKMR